ncbi:MAG: LamG-like jellyroll fold domain-containing protein, partial [Pirellulales bacterium]
NVTISDNEIFGNTVHGVEASGNVLVHRNAVHDNTSRGVVAYRGAQVVENVVFRNTVGIQLGSRYSSATARNNRVYDNTGTGIVSYYQSDSLGNVVYSNPIGIAGYRNGGAFSGDIQNNLVYETVTQAILLDRAQNARVSNNTIYHDAGEGIRVQSSSSGANLSSNIIWTADGYGVSVAGNSQNGFQSDFNLFQTTGTGQVALWQGVARPSLIAWRNAAFTDQNSLDQNPEFVDPDGADNQFGYVNDVNDGRDDDFHLKSTEGRFTGSLAPVFDATNRRPVFLSVVEQTDAVQSPAIDRGDANFSFVNEPAPNGNFVNLGAYGNTAQASKSPLEYVLVTIPDGGEVWPADQTFPIRWRSDILENALTGGRATNYAAAVLGDTPLAYWRLNEGGPTAADSSTSAVVHDGTYENGVFQGARSLLIGDLAARFDGSNDRIVVPDDAELRPAGLTVEALVLPESGIGNGDTVLIKTSTGSWNDGYGLYYNAGKIRFFVNNSSSGSVEAPITLDTWSHVVGTYDGSQVRLYVNGTLVNSRVYTTPLNHSTNSLQIGQGTSSYQTWTGRIDDVAIYDRALTDTEIADHHTVATTPIGTQVDIELLRDGDSSFNLLLADDLANSGEMPWTIPDTIAPQDDYRVRVTRVDKPALRDVSNQVFSITAPITTYYVNLPTDTDFSDNEYTSAPGDDANSGLFPNEPKSSVRAVLEAFDLDPGDTILVDTGEYSLDTNILVTADDAGVRIQGAQGASHETILNRGNTAGGSYVFELVNADGLTLDALTLTGGY